MHESAFDADIAFGPIPAPNGGSRQEFAKQLLVYARAIDEDIDAAESHIERIEDEIAAAREKLDLVLDALEKAVWI